MNRVRAYVELGKLRLSSMAVFAVLAGLFLGAPQGEFPTLGLTIATLVGTVLVAVGGNALNMYLERDTDPHMDRTQGRPLPTGRLSTAEVFSFGIGTAMAGTALLWFTTNALATVLCAVIFLTYVLVYTPMKRRTTLNTLVGAVPGALPPVVGYVASSGRLDLVALVLFFIVFFWQIPHFLAIAWRYREEYRAAGLQMLPVVDPDGRSTGLQMIVYCVSLVAVSVLPSFPHFGLTGRLYMYAALGLGAVFFVTTFLAAVLRHPSAMRQCFLVSIVYLPVLFSVMVVDKILRGAA